MLQDPAQPGAETGSRYRSCVFWGQPVQGRHGYPCICDLAPPCAVMHTATEERPCHGKGSAERNMLLTANIVAVAAAAAAAAAADYTNLGCYALRPNRPPLPQLLLESPRLQPGACIKAAAAYKYFALFNSTRCYAGNDLAPSLRQGRSSKNCTAPCGTGSAWEGACGGPAAFSLYVHHATSGTVAATLSGSPPKVQDLGGPMRPKFPWESAFPNVGPQPPFAVPDVAHAIA
jgi:hypothetical protein